MVPAALQWTCPALGAAVGYDIELASALSFGVEARDTYADFGGEGAGLYRASGSSRLYQYDASAWLGLAVVGTLLESLCDEVAKASGRLRAEHPELDK